MVQTRFNYLLNNKRRLEHKRYSLRQVARDTGLSYTTVYYWYHGRIAYYRPQALERLCLWLDCPLSALIVLIPDSDN